MDNEATLKGRVMGIIPFSYKKYKDDAELITTDIIEYCKANGKDMWEYDKVFSEVWTWLENR